MVLQLYFWIFVYIAFFAGGGYGVYRVVQHLLESDEKRVHRRLGKRNALLLKAHMEEVCRFCDLPTDPEHDLYDEKIGWHHPNCYQKLLND